MDEKTAMNVEFLRARLLSERIVSKTARQRAEMLSQRVIELEEQLRMVNIQRKKAEKAAEEVLSILETQGITCVSGLTDSSADEKNNLFTDQESSQCIISEDVKDDKSLTSSRMDRSEVVDGLSCSDIDGSPSVYRRLSWKSHASSLDSQEKVKTKQNRCRQRSSFAGAPKSSPRRPGKSCRKIKKSDVGSASENELQKPSLPHAHGDGVTAHSDDFDEKHEYPLEVSETKMNKSSLDSSLPFRPDGRNRESENGGNDEMERALEQQAQLITQFQAMENAQKEWEEKFNGTEMSMLDNHEPVNQINMVQNSNCSVDSKVPRHEDEKISVKGTSFTEDKNVARCKNCEMTNKKVNGDNFSEGASPTSASSPGRTGPNGHDNSLSNPMYGSSSLNAIEATSKASKVPPLHGSNLTNKARLEPSFTKSKELYAPDNRKNLRGFEKPVIRHEQAHTLSIKKLTPITDEMISRPIGTNLGCVLQSLQQAQISINHELVRRPNSPMKPNVPIDSSALFRLPSDSYPQALSGMNLYGSGLRLAATRLDLGMGNEYPNQFSSPYAGAGSKLSSTKDYDVQYPSSPYTHAHKVHTNRNPAGFVESASPVSSAEQHFDRRSSSSFSVSSPGRYPLYLPDLSSDRPTFQHVPLKSSSDLRIRKPYNDGYNYGRTTPSPI
ncbi:uncharacterized protein LOC110022460 [Phalaenopsis equestris]|uniref:uncharacterized protein LOC110022460 n=1 Tax=Phalaenopsis equestris TaxID=78828 RepID=UPI0009E46576|nr:uncharacterized protein LOC110022460 [Phalaenopsis equestris]